MTLNISSWSSSLSMSKSRPTSTPKKHSNQAPPQPPLLSSNMSNGDFVSQSRSSSLAGRKRPRESDSDAKNRLARRTKSTGDARLDGRRSKDKDREAFQRGLIAVFVPNALKESLVGRSEHYNDLLAHFLPGPSAPQPLLQPLLPLLRALTAHVSLLVPETHGALVSAIIGLPWAAGEEKLVRVFIGFCGVLVSAQPGWAKEVVSMAIKGLRWQHKMPNTSSIPISRRLYHARHHLLLAHLLSLIPTLPSVIQPLLSKHFPNKREAEVAQTTWVRNCCELIGYCPELGQRIWGMIVDRMLRIDSEISKDEDEVEEEEEETEDEHEEDEPLRYGSPGMPDPFEIPINEDIPKPINEVEEEDDEESDFDVDELSSNDGASSEEEDESDEQKAVIAHLKKKEAVKAMKQKLDGMMIFFFQHLSETMGGRPVSTPATEVAVAGLSTGSVSSSGASTPTLECPNPISTFPHIATTKPSPTPAQSLSHFQTLLTLFTRQILPTSSTQHVPFLLFFTSALTVSHTDLFLGLLVSQALYGTSTASPSIGSQPLSLAQRIASTVYIGSIVCRAKFVTDEQARQVMTYLLAYIDGKMHQTKPDDPPLFYAVCQAVMLIFCFRWRAFGNDKDGESILGEMELEGETESVEGDGRWMRDLDVLQRVITSDLNPLLGCNPTIVSTFAKVAHQTNFAYCFSIIEANQAHSRSSTSSTPATTPGARNSTTRQNSLSYSAALNTARNARQANIDSGLDSYFPFDPYDLPRSKRFVEHLYRAWGDVAINTEESDDEDDDDEEESEEEEEESEDIGDSDSDLGGSAVKVLGGRGIPKIKNGSYSDRRKRIFDRDEGLSSSLEGMSISPNVSRHVR